MDSVVFSEIVNKQFGRCLSLLEVKNNEYTPDLDRLSHFKKAAVLMGCSPKQALVGMLSKHIISIFDMCNTQTKMPVERWNEKITDTINYMLLLSALVMEENNE